jgi:hypothetical protein
MSRRFLSASLLVLVSLGTFGCHRSKSYEANVEVTRVSPIRKDEAGKVLTQDFEFSYFECPGTQIEVVRGDAKFAECTAKYKAGDKVKVAIDHKWADEGVYKWNVTKIGDCARIQDPNDEASYALVRECDDWAVNGTRVGFECKYTPEKKLVDKCPWFRRR